MVGSHRFIIPGPPIGKGRPRGAVRGGFVKMYTPKKTSDWEKSAAMLIGGSWRQAPEDGPVEVTILAAASRPKRLLRKKDPDGLIWKTSKPDSYSSGLLSFASNSNPLSFCSIRSLSFLRCSS